MAHGTNDNRVLCTVCLCIGYKMHFASSRLSFTVAIVIETNRVASANDTKSSEFPIGGSVIHAHCALCALAASNGCRLISSIILAKLCAIEIGSRPHDLSLQLVFYKGEMFGGERSQWRWFGAGIAAFAAKTSRCWCSMRHRSSHRERSLQLRFSLVFSNNEFLSWLHEIGWER